MIYLSLFFSVNSQVKPTPTLIPKIGDISIKISAPYPGQALQGSVSIQGETNVAGFSRGELSFSYTNDPTDTWFLIQELETPARGELYRWDTTTISDGDYNLRLLVTLNDGRQSTVIISGLRVRNYTPIETETPAARQNLTQSAGYQTTPSPLAKVARSTSTALPANPLSLSQKGFYDIFSQGAMAGLVIVIVITLIGAVKNSKKNR